MTAHAMTGDRERCLEAGMDGCIGKPIRVADLMEEIRRHAPQMPLAASSTLPPGSKS
jgi:two-component system sensor histidine kinase/response regulator